MITENNKIYPIGLYTRKQRLQVFLFILIVGAVLIGAFRIAMLFFHSYSSYSNYIAIAAIALLLLFAVISIFVKNLDGLLKVTMGYLLPALLVFLACLTLSVILIENGVIDIKIILGWFE